MRRTDCVGCAAGDSQSEAEFALLYYQTGEPNKTAVAASWVYDGLTYLMLWRGDDSAIDASSTLVNTVIMGFEIEGLE